MSFETQPFFDFSLATSIWVRNYLATLDFYCLHVREPDGHCIKKFKRRFAARLTVQKWVERLEPRVTEEAALGQSESRILLLSPRRKTKFIIARIIMLQAKIKTVLLLTRAAKVSWVHFRFCSFEFHCKCISIRKDYEPWRISSFSNSLLRNRINHWIFINFCWHQQHGKISNLNPPPKTDAFPQVKIGLRSCFVLLENNN